MWTESKLSHVHRRCGLRRREAYVSVRSVMGWRILRAVVVSHCHGDTASSILLVFFSSCSCPRPWLAPTNLTDFWGPALSGSEIVRRGKPTDVSLAEFFGALQKFMYCILSSLRGSGIQHMKKFSPHFFFFVLKWRQSEEEHPLQHFWFQRSCSVFGNVHSEMKFRFVQHPSCIF